MKNTKILALVGIIIFASILRLYKLDKNPPSLFGDELDLGYQAYSILKTGRDYSGNFLPLHFHSLAEWRTPLYLYSAVPTVALFGITAWGVRLPAAIFGILTIPLIYFLFKELSQKFDFKIKNIELIASLLLAISPWHIQYSRAGFEVTQMLFFLLLGLFLFFKSFKEGKWLWISIMSFCLTPYDYSTAKLFTPFFLLFLLIVFWKEIRKIPKIHLLEGIVAGILFGGPIALSTLFGGGTVRFNYISVFSDPTIQNEVGVARQTEAHVRGESGSGLTPTILDKIFNNKFNTISEVIAQNYLQSFSFNFLFGKGDPNLRQSAETGLFYKIEVTSFAAGSVFFFSQVKSKKLKLLILFWFLIGALPAELTRDGGNHATRLFLTLPLFILLISYGLTKFPKTVLIAYALILLSMFISYEHLFWTRYPLDSERWWHYGYGEAFNFVKQNDQNYDKIIISTHDEPPWIFFAGHLEFNPSLWQQNYPFPKINFLGFGEISHIGKYYFGSPKINGGLYGWGKLLDSRTLYLASQKEVSINLVQEPERTPANLKVIKAIIYPSGEPAFYIFSGIGK
ncbi:MAG: glycosyltransferase family 39 protein [Candidatus Woesebacteria bacterium]|nr:MAG: glycosyltransferase family 39 protein [Candidatus Woesebacteria bacterium]